jgi:hypothetical protein
MTDLSPDTTNDFLERFCRFDDAVLRSCNTNLDPEARWCDLGVDAIDAESPSGWSHVTIRVQEIRHILIDLHTGADVLSFGMQIFYVGDAVRVYIDPHPNGEEMLELSESLAFVIGTSLQWESRFISSRLLQL